MNLRRVSARTAVAGVTTALAATALVGATGTAANAVDATSTYSCTAMGASVGDFTMAVSTPVVPAEGTAGQSFPAGLLQLTSTITIPAGAAGLLATYGVDGGHIDDYAVHLGSTDITAVLNFDAPEAQEDGSATMLGGGANDAFSLPGAGTYKVNLPESFTFTPTSNGSDLPVTIGCTSAAPGDLGSITLTKGASSLTAKAAKKGKIKVAVTRPFDDVVPAGKVVAKVGKKSWKANLNKKGKAVIKLPKSVKGKKATVIYKGDEFTAAASKVKVKVK
jgi:hypothetical protein